MSGQIEIVVAGANTPAGEALIERLAEARLPIARLVPAAAGDPEGTVRYGERHLSIHPLDGLQFTAESLVLFAGAPLPVAAHGERATEAGALVLDLTGHWASDPQVPLVTASTSAEELTEAAVRGRMALPGPLALHAATLLGPVARAAGLARVDLTLLRAAAALGQRGIEALAGETARLLNAMPLEEPPLFGRQLAFNLLPETGPAGADGLTADERETASVLARLLGVDPSALEVAVLQAPVFYGDSLLARFETLEPLPRSRLLELLSAAADLDEAGEGGPTAVTDAATGERLAVGRIRGAAGGLSHALWSVVDPDRVLSAGNGVQIAEFLVKDYLLTNS